MLLSSISLALTRLGQRLGRWSPLALWPDGIDSPGMWIDPSLLTASFNDYTGTTPVSIPGTVADTSNPVGLALDIRAGAPTTLGPELVVNGDFAAGSTGWTLETGWSVSGGQASISNAGNIYAIYQAGLTAGKTYLASVTVASVSAGGFNYYCGGNRFTEINLNSPGTYTAILTCGANGFLGVGASESGTTGSIDNISFKEIPGNHMLQATSAARPLESARVNLLTYTENFEGASWSGPGSAGSDLLDFVGGPDKYQAVSVVVGVPYLVEFDYSLVSGSDGEFGVQSWGPDSVVLTATSAVQRYSGVHTFASATGYFVFTKVAGGSVFRITKMSLSHGSMDVEYQAILTDGSSYSATGITPFQLYDGVDDGMATEAFTAGTMINGMDCLIAVRRDSAAACVAGLYNGIADATKFFGMAESGSGSGCVGSGAGTPTVWVDGVQLSGGTAVTRGTLHTALTVGDWHILEFRGLDLSTWTAAGFGLYTSYVFPGARGDILLYPSTASTEDKDAARQYLADYYGVTLP